MWFTSSKKLERPDPAQPLPGRETPIAVSETHLVSGNRIVPPFPEGAALALFGMGCFWGAERIFWSLDGSFLVSLSLTFRSGTSAKA